MSSTYKDLQRVTGLSLATISKFYNGGNVRTENREALERAARDLDFRPNELARSLRTRRSGTVGVLLPELDNEFHAAIVAGIEHGLKDSGTRVLVVTTQGTSAGVTAAVNLLSDRRVDGMVVVPGEHDGEAVGAAAARGVPLVLVDRLVTGSAADAVVLDNAGATARVVAELTGAGHRDIALLGGPSSIWTMAQRAQGFRRAVRAAGIALARDRVVRAPLTVESGRSAMHELLGRSPRPTAVCTANHELTVGALIALGEAGIDLPRDLSFVGFDGQTLARVTTPRLTTFVQPAHEIARAAADLLRTRLSPDGAGAPPRRVVLAGELVRGASVGAPPADHAR
ncbi:LacI family DNA-binding transcriptional regulator [Kineococcus rhizosphaerae]|uniref:LacI family transcriptional regulator n=1 Tax=Kineococcus rhizosphaerae TaxID=559628 RepID=A0A2T0QZC7_9ACTN|nr:LacI family DNA-binding transcriptional regulator [Kineococcus rhizosphaerae]PRY11873.1 LacI family transcriptional regulator [Kineococcus rhizosphaerae]